MHRRMLLVCHAADGHFADGNREAIQQLLAQPEIGTIALGQDRYELYSHEEGTVCLYAPGLSGQRAFHRMELTVSDQAPMASTTTFLFNAMQVGGFGLMEHLDAPYLIVTQPQQVAYFPWLPEPPLLVRDPIDLGHIIGDPVF